MSSAPSVSSAAAENPDAAPFGPEDHDAQDDALDFMREQAGDAADIPQWEFCDGFLAALVCTRRPLAPAEYWPVLLGEHFVPAQHMEFVWRWRRRWREVQAALDDDGIDSLDDPRAYWPATVDHAAMLAALPPDARQGAHFEALPAYAQVWALGFLSAVEAWFDEWAPPRDREVRAILDDALGVIEELALPQRRGASSPPPAAGDALAPDAAGDAPPPGAAGEAPPSVPEARLDLLAEAIWAVHDLRRLWRSLGPRQVSVRAAPVPGRNDPCPCGSGKKYKKCHGA